MENPREIELRTEEKQRTETKKIQNITPGQMRVIKRNGSVVPYNQEKIIIAINFKALNQRETIQKQKENIIA